jgi:hypothetical protein
MKSNIRTSGKRSLIWSWDEIRGSGLFLLLGFASGRKSPSPRISPLGQISEITSLLLQITTTLIYEKNKELGNHRKLTGAFKISICLLNLVNVPYFAHRSSFITQIIILLIFHGFFYFEIFEKAWLSQMNSSKIHGEAWIKFKIIPSYYNMLY